MQQARPPARPASLDHSLAAPDLPSAVARREGACVDVKACNIGCLRDDEDKEKIPALARHCFVRFDVPNKFTAAAVQCIPSPAKPIHDALQCPLDSQATTCEPLGLL